MAPASLGTRTARASFWGATEIASRHIVQLGVMLVLARMLDPSDFGLVAMLVVFTSVGSVLSDSGLGWALVQRRTSDPDDETTAFLFSFVVAILCAAIIWLAAPSISRFYRQPDLARLVPVMVLVLPLTVLSLVPDALLARSLDFRTRAKAEGLASSVSGGVALALAWCGAGVWSLVVMPSVLAMIRAPLLWVWSGWRPRGRFRWAVLHRLFGFGGYLMASNLLDALSIRLQSLLLGRIFDAQSLGFYTLAQQTDQAPTTFIASLLNRVGIPVFTTVADDLSKFEEALRRALRLSMFLYAPVMVGIALAAKPLVLFLYGAAWQPMAPILALMALGSAFWPMHVLNLAAINALGRSDLVLRLNLVKKLVLIVLVAIAAPRGPVAIAGAILASSIAAVAVNTWFSRRMTGIGLLTQLYDQLQNAGSLLVAACTAWLLLAALPVGSSSFLVAAVMAALLYVASAWVLRNPALSEMWIMARALVSREVTR